MIHHIICSMPFYTGLFDRDKPNYAYHSGVWFLLFLGAWVLQFHRTNYDYDYVTQSLHVSTPDTIKQSYWTLDMLTHGKYFPGGNSFSSVGTVSTTLCLHANNCFKSQDGSAVDGSSMMDTCHTTSLANDQERPHISCAVPQNLRQDAVVCDQTHHQANEYPLMETLCQQQFQPIAAMQLTPNEPSAYSISASHSPRVLMFVVLTIMTVCNLYMFVTALYKNEFRWLRNIVDTFSNAVIGDQENVKAPTKLCMFKRYLLAPIFTVLMLVWWFVFYNTTQHVVYWPKPFGTIFYAVISLVFVLYLGAGVDNTEKSTDNGNQPEVAQVVNEKPESSTEQVPASNGQSQMDVSSFGKSNKFKLAAFLQPGKNNYKSSVAQHWVEKSTFSASNYKAATTKHSYFTLMQTWVLPFLFLSVYLLKHNFHIDSNITVIFVAMILFGLMEIASKRLYEVGNVFEAILEDSKDADHAMKVAPITVIRLLILCMQALLVWYVYSVAHWDLNSSSDGYWHVGMASPKNYFDSVQMTFSVSFIVYFGLVSLTKLYVLSPMNMYGDSYKEFVQSVTNHFDEIAVFILNCFVAFVFVYEVGALGGILFENDNLSFDNPAFLMTLASRIQ